MENRPCPLCRLPARWNAGEAFAGLDIACPGCMSYSISADALTEIRGDKFPGYKKLRLMQLSRDVFVSGARLLVDLEVVRSAGE